ncbi:MAG: hypothetical protein ABR936_11870 [Bacteroidota bacterium]
MTQTTNAPDFLTACKMTIEELGAIPEQPIVRDLRHHTLTEHPTCIANCRADCERQCRFFHPTIATCAGEISYCINRGKSYPLSGYTYCTLNQPIIQ